jgi:hypothetical protein
LEQEIMIHVSRHHWTNLPSFNLALAAMPREKLED